jgi:membrane-bound serine protease (ClpP class)
VNRLLLRGFLASLVVAGLAVFLCSTTLAAEPKTTAAHKPRVLAITFDEEVNPVTKGYVDQQLNRAVKGKYDAAVILLDTPGGLSESMREIVQKELEVDVPVIVYVSPKGARAASAGVWIGEAADVLAMAPATNIGSSTPISGSGQNIGSDLRRKVINDAAASLRTLMKAHGRNAAWGDKAVRKAANLSETEALRMNVVDLVSPSLPALLNTIDGRKVDVLDRHFTLNTADAEVTTAHMSTWQKILNTLIDPNIIALMLSLGLLGIVVELWHPGLIFPGTVGAISLLVSLYGLNVLPIGWTGVLFMLLAFAFWGAEPFVPSHGALALAGGVFFVLGTLFLFEPAGPGFQVSLPLSITIAALMTAFIGFAVVKVVAIRRRPPTVGVHTMVGVPGVVRSGNIVSVKGELWSARSTTGGPLLPGEQVVVEEVENGLRLVVRPVRVPVHA